jgi:RNA polymerase sigma-70 factor (ECF subfamily)
VNTPVETQDFVRLWTQHARRIYAFLLTLVVRPADADDLLQETSMVLWEKFNQFTPGSDFYAWACKIAHFCVCNHRRRQAAAARIVDDDVLSLLEAELAASGDEIDAELQALAECFEKLRPRDQDLITRRYRAGASMRTVASEVGRTVEALYKAIQRIHESLFECVRRRVGEEAR